MIGKLDIEVKHQPKLGDRDDFIIRITGPDPKTDYSFPLSLTGSIIAVWGEKSAIAADTLAGTIIEVIGTAKEPPKEGFWFDSFNSESSVKDTQNLIKNKGVKSFLKDPTSYEWLLGDEAYKNLEGLNELIRHKFGEPMLSSFEQLGEVSQIKRDMGSDPQDNPNYLYRICLLSGIIDHIRIGISSYSMKCPSCGNQIKGSLDCFNNWLQVKIGAERTDLLTKSFKMVKKLRNQYPIHDHFDIKLGLLGVRHNIDQANSYFGITNDKDYSGNWHKILKAFNNSIIEIENAFK